MYRPSKYETHNKSLDDFAKLFNSKCNPNEMIFIYNEDENFSDDGKIILYDLNKEIYYDWEKRDRYFENGVFKFNTLGQFERKFHKNPKIGITIQCDSSENHVLVALHSSFKEKRIVSRLTDSYNEVGGMRETSDFIIYSYDEIDKLIDQIRKWALEDKEDFLEYDGAANSNE